MSFEDPVSHEAIVGILRQCRKLGADELCLLERIACRLVAGSSVYGRLSLGTDPRCWHEERFEEAADLLVYAAAAEVKERRSR